MTPAEMYEAPFHEKDHEIQWLMGCYYSHVPEIGTGYNILPFSDDTERIEVRSHASIYHDIRREHRVRSVWLDGSPVMVCVNAGREGDDHHARWVTDLEAYAELLKHLGGMIFRPEVELELADLNEEQPGMTEFYHRDLAPILGKRAM